MDGGICLRVPLRGLLGVQKENEAPQRHAKESRDVGTDPFELRRGQHRRGLVDESLNRGG